MEDPFKRLRLLAAHLHGCALQEIVIELGHSIRVLRSREGGMEVLEVADTTTAARSDTTVGCVASALARRAQSDVYAAEKAIAAAERAVSEAQYRLKTAQGRLAELTSIARGAFVAEEPDGPA